MGARLFADQSSDDDEVYEDEDDEDLDEDEEDEDEEDDEPGWNVGTFEASLP